MIQHRVEVDVGEVDALFGAVEDPLPRQVAVQVHLAEPDGVRVVVALLDRRHRPDVGLVAHRGQRPDRHLDGLGEVRRIHRLGDVHRTQVARDVLAHFGIGQVVVEHRRRGHLQDLRAQVRVGDLALDRVGPVHRVLVHDVRVAGLELQLGQRLEELARLDLRLADARVVDHLVVLLGHRDVGERHTVDPLDVIRREQVHVLVPLGQLEGDVRDHDAEPQRLDADLLVGVLALGVEEPVDVGVVSVQVHRAGALARAELVGVGERVLQQLHDRDDARALVLDVLDRRAVLANVAQQQRNSAAALGQLQRGVDGAPDGLHVVLDAQQKAVVHDRAANRVRMRALDVEVVYLLRNVLRTHHVADSVHMPPMHNLVCRAGRPLSAYVVVQILADIEDELFVRAGQTRNERLTSHVACTIDVLANDGNRSPDGGGSAAPDQPIPDSPGRASSRRWCCTRPRGTTRPAVHAGTRHRPLGRRGTTASSDIRFQPWKESTTIRSCCCTPCEPNGPTALCMHGELGSEHPLECCRQLLLVCELVCAKREVNTVRC